MATAGLRKLFDGVVMMPKGIFLSEKCDPLGTSIHDLSADISKWSMLFVLSYSSCSSHREFTITHNFECYMSNLHDASTTLWRNSEAASEIPGVVLARAGFATAPEAVHACPASGPISPQMDRSIGKRLKLLCSEELRLMVWWIENGCRGRQKVSGC